MFVLFDCHENPIAVSERKQALIDLGKLIWPGSIYCEQKNEYLDDCDVVSLDSAFSLPDPDAASAMLGCIVEENLKGPVWYINYGMNDAGLTDNIDDCIAKAEERRAKHNADCQKAFSNYILDSFKLIRTSNYVFYAMTRDNGEHRCNQFRAYKLHLIL